MPEKEPRPPADRVPPGRDRQRMRETPNKREWYKARDLLD